MAHIARRLPPELLPEALELTRRVFLEFEAPDYPPEGVEEFLRFLEDRETLAGLAFWGRSSPGCWPPGRDTSACCSSTGTTTGRARPGRWWRPAPPAVPAR